MSEDQINYGLTQRPQSRPDALIETSSQREIAEVQAAMMLAKKFPRDPIAALERITNACARPKLAEAALYEYNRGGTDITGPSIRLAEAIAQNWGNLQFGIRELEQRPGESTVEAFAWDIETNTREIKVFQVPHVRYSKAKGNVKLIDPRDIYEMIANQGARRLRACILGIIPGDVVETAVQQCEETLKAKIKITPEYLKEVIEAFKKFGISKEQIEKKIQRRLESITPAQVLRLHKIHNSLKDGMSTPIDWFEVEIQSKAKMPEEKEPTPGKDPYEIKNGKAPEMPQEPPKEEPNDTQANEDSAPQAATASDKPKPAGITKAQRGKLFVMMGEKDMEDATAKEFYHFVLGKQEATAEWASEFISNFYNYLDLYQDSKRGPEGGNDASV